MKTSLSVLLLLGCFWQSVSAYELPGIPEDDPWGEVEVREFHLAPQPNPLLVPFVSQNSGRWIFSVRNAAEMEADLMEWGIPPEWILRIRSLPFQRTHLGWETRPPESVLLALPMEVRGNLYRYLTEVAYDFSSFRIAPYIQDPERTRQRVAEQFSEELAELFERLLWKDGQAHYFSDFHVLFDRLPDDTTRAELESLLREWRSSIATFTVSESSGAMMISEEFWGAQRANPGGRNLVQSFAGSARSEGPVESVDISLLLPPTPRKMLHSFPVPEMLQGDDLPDCYWTALNFFGEEPSDRVFDFSSNSFYDFLDAEYESVEGSGMLGDVIVMSRLREDGSRDLVHACNYLFEDYVYTKNGKSLNNPWIIARWSELLPLYHKPGEEVEVERFRSKDRS